MSKPDMMDSCDIRTKAYRNGKTFDECRSIARGHSQKIGDMIRTKKTVAWSEILDMVDHDELVYKLTLKYLRQDGFDIGNYKAPVVKT